MTFHHSELGRISTSLADELEAAAAGLRANPEARYTAPNGLDLILEKVSRFFAPPIHSRFSYQLEELKNLDAALCQQIEDFLKPGSKTTGSLPGGRDEEELIQQCVEVIVSAGEASASRLMRHLKIPYAQATRILDELEQRRVVGPAKGPNPRDVLMIQD